MKLFDKKSLILLISVVSINLLCIISVSYAYFTANIIGNDKAEEMTVTAGTMKITYTDSNIVTLNNAIPGDSLTKQFKVENTGNLDTKYNIKINIENNEFEDYNDLKYTLTKNGEQQPEKVLPYEDGYIVIENEIKEKGIDNYTLTLNFKKDNSNQNDNANKKVKFKIEVDSETDVRLYEYQEPYKDNSGANRPKLYQGLIPITFNEDNTMKIADITKEWYNYDEHKWGNAVLIDNTNEEIRNKFYKEDGTLRINQAITEEDILQMYVWIPRYKYQLFNAVAGESVPEQMINIEFEKGVTSTGNVSCKYINEGNGTIREDCENAINGNWYTHPAFTFGDTELPGIWVGKFKPTFTLPQSTEEILILPNKSFYYSHSMQRHFYLSNRIEKTSKYNLNEPEIDIHPLKSIDWGSIAYLTNSKYGRYINAETCVEGGCEVWFNNVAIEGISTGCSADSNTEGPNRYITTTVENCEISNQWNNNGVHASTTDNIYGIYDMHGAGNWTRVMGNIVDESGKFLPGSSGFTTPPDSKYYDIYSFSGSFRGHLGDATREVYNPSTIENKNYNYWYTSNSNYPSDVSSPWLIRGGAAWYPDTSGIFTFSDNKGGSYNAWVVITAQDGTA